MGHAKKKDGKRSDALEISPAYKKRLPLRGFGRGNLRRAARLPGVYFAAQRKALLPKPTLSLRHNFLSAHIDMYKPLGGTIL